MNLNVRRTLLLLALVAFAVITPILILYALGFRPAARLGVLVVESIPSRALIIVEGKEVGATPHTISGFGGESMNVKIRKDGYRVWEKQLSIAAGVTSEVTSIRLIPETLVSHTLAATMSQFSLAPNRILLAVVDDKNQLTIRDEAGRLIVLPIPLPSLPQRLLWSPDSSFILVSYLNRRHEIISLQRAQRQNVPAFAASQANTITWDPRVPGRLLALDTQSTLFVYDTVSQTKSILASSISAFAVTDREIVIISQNTLRHLSLVGELTNVPAIPVEKPVKRLLAAPSGHIVILFGDSSIALVKEKTIVPLASSVANIGFAPSGQLLYLQTAPNELVVYNIDDSRLRHIPLQRTQLVTRISQPISHPQWFAGGEHIIYQVGDQIVLTEIDTRDRAVSEVIDATNLADAQVSVAADGEALFYLKKQNDSVDLIRTELVAP